MTALNRIALDDLPEGSVKLPLGLPRGAAWPVVAQIAALSQRVQGCTASIGYLADQTGLSQSSVYAALSDASPWIITKGRARWLAPIPDDVPWARISYRAAAGVGCHSMDGIWTARRNRSLLLELYCHLRRDEALGGVRTQGEIAERLGLSVSALKNLLRTLIEDGWISAAQEGRKVCYRTHDAALRMVNTPGRSSSLTGNDQATSVETIKPADWSQKHDTQAGPEKHDFSPLAVGDLQHRKRVDHEALRERPKPGSDSNEQATAEPRAFFVGREPYLLEVLDLGSSRPPSGLSVRVSGAPSVMCAIPLDWQIRMSESDRERVMAAIEAEMSTGRTVAEMTVRVRRRLAVWRGRQVRRPVAAALTVVRRGYDCPRPECEDHMLPSGSWCGACAEMGARVNRERLAAVVGGGVADGPPRPERGLQAAALQPPPPLRVPATFGATGVDAASSPRAAEAIAQARAELAALRRKPA